MRSVIVEPLSAEKFAPYGDVLRNDGGVRRNFCPASTAPGCGPGDLRLWVSRVDPVPAAPLSIVRLERHPYAAQTFLPLKIGRWLIVVAPSMSDGNPDVRGIKAFVAGPGNGICYRRGTWHHGTTVLDEAAFLKLLKK